MSDRHSGAGIQTKPIEQSSRTFDQIFQTVAQSKLAISSNSGRKNSRLLSIDSSWVNPEDGSFGDPL